jgi:hypothetical protein
MLKTGGIRSTLETSNQLEQSQSDLLPGTLNADQQARDQWVMSAGRGWDRQDHGLVLSRSDSEWATAEWQQWRETTLQKLENIVIEVTVSGKASAAGLSFGQYRTTWSL